MSAYARNYAYVIERSKDAKEQKPISKDRIEQAKKNVEKYLAASANGKKD